MLSPVSNKGRLKMLVNDNIVSVSNNSSRVIADTEVTSNLRQRPLKFFSFLSFRWKLSRSNVKLNNFVHKLKI